MKKLTEKQAAVLHYISSYMHEYGRAPSYSDIGKQFKVSSTAASNTVRSIVKKGYLEKKDRSLRSLALPLKIREKKENIAVDLYRREPTASELDSNEQAADHCYIPRFLEDDDCFAFCVTSESMIGAGINPGDIAIMSRKTDKLKDGDIVLALGSGQSADEIELRTFRGIANGAILSPDNVAMGERRVTKVLVYGILVRLERSYR